MTYRIGLSTTEVSEQELLNSGLQYSIVIPREHLVESVKKVVGRPYKRGASVLKDTPESFDCSCLASWAAVEAGFSIPRVTIDQYVFAKKITKEELLPGDLIFVNTKHIVHTEGTYFSQVLGKIVKEEPVRYETLEYMPGTKVPEGIDHVGIFIGEGKVIHATSSKGGVVEEMVNASSSFTEQLHYGRIVDDESPRFVVEIPNDRPELRSREKLLEEVKKQK